jgi:cytoskeletal protein RodZ
MPHKHNDIKHGVDPEQIRRYLAGELDDKAMHILERQALEDLFLAEALDGFETYPADQSANLEELDRRLEKRVAGAKERKMLVYFRWAAAAVILIAAGIGGLKLWQTPLKQEIAKMNVPHDSAAPADITNEKGESLAGRADKPPATFLPDLKLKKESDQSVVLEKQPSAPSVSLREQKQSDSLAGAMDVAAAEPVPAPVATAPEKEVATEKSNGLVTIYRPPEALASRMAGVATTKSKARVLQGKIISEKNDSGLAGVSVAVAGTNNGALTDKDGRFAIRLDSTSNVQLNVAALGYATKKVAVGNEENNLKIAVPENNQSLNEQEVVVTGYGASRKKAKKAAYQAPMPGEGFDRYKEYLTKHVRYPVSAGDIKGNVRIAFTVRADGTLEDFTVIRKLQPDCDTEAIRVVKEGPAWIPASDGRATRAQVDVPFAP